MQSWKCQVGRFHACHATLESRVATRSCRSPPSRRKQGRKGREARATSHRSLATREVAKRAPPYRPEELNGWMVGRRPRRPVAVTRYSVPRTNLSPPQLPISGDKLCRSPSLLNFLCRPARKQLVCRAAPVARSLTLFSLVPIRTFPCSHSARLRST